MQTVTREMIKTALANDTDTTAEQRQAILAALKSADPNRKPKLITRKQAAEILVCSTKTIDRYIERGLIREIKFTQRRIRFEEAEIIRFAREGVAA